MSSFKDREKAKERRNQAYNYLVQGGLSPHLAAGVVGNLMQESYGHLDSAAVGDGGKSVGIAQWNGQRLANLKKYAKDTKGEYKNLDTQLGFLLKEINSTYSEGSSSWNKKQQGKFFKAKNAEEAAEAFMVNFERPSEGHLLNRKKYATKIYLEYNDNNVYSKDKKGNIVSVNPKAATPEVLEKSPEVKQELYKQEFTELEKQNTTESEVTKKRNESEALIEAKKEIQDKYNEYNFLQSVLAGGNTGVAVGNVKTMSDPQATPEEAAEPATEVTTGKDELLAQTFKQPQQTQQTQQQPQSAQGPEMYPGLERTENEYYQAYLPEGFEEGGEAGTNPTDPEEKHLANLEIDSEGDYRFIQELPEVSITGKGRTTPPPNIQDLNLSNSLLNFSEGVEPNTEEEYIRLSSMLNNNLTTTDLKANEVQSVQQKTNNPIKPQMSNISLNPEVLENLKPSDISSIAEAITTVDLNNLNPDFSKLNKNEAKAMQRTLVESGDLELKEKLPASSNSKQVTALQLKLKEAGYDLGNYGPNKDGVDGKLGAKTKKALAQYNTERTDIDGEIGPITEAAYAQYKERLKTPQVANKSKEGITKTKSDLKNIPAQGGVKALKQKFKNQGFNVSSDNETWDAETADNFEKFKNKIYSNKYPTAVSALTKTIAVQAGLDSRGNLTEDNFSEEALNTMRRLAVGKDGKISNGFGYDAARKESGVIGNDVTELMKYPINNLTSGREGVVLNLVLGQAGIIAAPDGYTYVFDDYDFNDVNWADKDMSAEEVKSARLEQVGVNADTSFLKRKYQEARADASASQRQFQIDAEKSGNKWRPSATLIKLGKTEDLLNSEKQKEYAPKLTTAEVLTTPLRALELGVHKAIDYFKE